MQNPLVNGRARLGHLAEKTREIIWCVGPIATTVRVVKDIATHFGVDLSPNSMNGNAFL